MRADDHEFSVRARVVINATGVWADDLRALDEGSDPGSIRPAKGVHLTVPWAKVRNEIAAIVPVPKDRRSVFVVPWGDFTYVGTTDTDYDGPLDDPQCSPEDVEYLLGALNRAISPPVTVEDISGTWAGLRPLLAQREQRTDRRPVPPPRGAGVDERRDHHHRREAHHLPADGRGHRRPGGPPARQADPVPDPSPPPRRRGRLRGPAPR